MDPACVRRYWHSAECIVFREARATWFLVALVVNGMSVQNAIHRLAHVAMSVPWCRILGDVFLGAYHSVYDSTPGLERLGFAKSA